MAERVLRLFPTPLIVDALEEAAEIAAMLEPLILERRGSDPGVSLSNRGGWQSKRDFPIWGGEGARRLIGHASALASANTLAAGRVAPAWRVDAWANVSGPGQFNMPHVHGGSFWSAVYYLRVPEGSGGELVLHDPRMPGLRMHAPNLRLKGAGPDVVARFKPQTGQMLLFPAWLSHSVEPWEGQDPRISIAMNIRAAPPRSTQTNEG